MKIINSQLLENESLQYSQYVNKAKLGLAGLAALGVLFPATAAMLPIKQELRFTALLGGIAASAGYVALEAISQQPAKVKKSIDNARLETLRNELKFQVVSDKFKTEILQTNKLLEMVLSLPVEQHSYWLNRFGIQSLRTAPPEQLPDDTFTIQHQLSVGASSQGDFQQMYNRAIASKLDTSWFKNWTDRSGVVCGESKDGKSILLQYVQSEYMREYPEGKLYICDVDYGSSHDGSEPNIWAGAKLGKIVFKDVQKCYEIILHIADQVDERSNKTAIWANQYATAKANGTAFDVPAPKFEPILLIIDEGQSLYSDLEVVQRDKYVASISKILIRGLKQGIRFKFGSQSLAVGKIGLDRTILSQVEAVLLHRAAKIENNYQNLLSSDTKGEEFKELLETIKRLPQKIGDKFVCITYVGKKFNLGAIPKISTAVTPPEQTAIKEKTIWDETFKEKYGEDPTENLNPVDPDTAFKKTIEFLEGKELTDENVRQAIKTFSGIDPTQAAIDYFRDIMKRDNAK